LNGLSDLCAAKGAKVIPLKVSVANHSPLVAGAVNDFAAFIEDIPFHAPTVPVLFNVTGAREQEPEAIKGIMARQIASRVCWLPIIEQMVAEGVEVFVELGPKNVLTGMMRKIIPKGTAISYVQADNPDGLAKVVEVVGAE
jgi:[acyl-carrier-protein] S-malonyltransferase